MIRDLTTGPVASRLLRFAFPLFLSNALQAVYNLRREGKPYVFYLHRIEGLHMQDDVSLTHDVLNLIIRSRSIQGRSVFYVKPFLCFIRDMRTRENRELRRQFL